MPFVSPLVRPQCWHHIYSPLSAPFYCTGVTACAGLDGSGLKRLERPDGGSFYGLYVG